MSKRLPWFRAYTEMMDDEKLRLLAFEDRWHFVAILCMKGAGILDESGPLLMRKAAVKMGLAVRELEEVARRLSEVGLIDAATLQPLAWDARQMKSDSSAERVQAYRERQKHAKQGGNVTVTAQDTDTDTDTDRGVSSGKERVVAPPSAGAQAPAPKPPKKSPKTPPPPEIETVRAITGRYPDKVLWPQIIATISSSGKDSEYIGSLYTTWRSRGYSPTNYAWLLEWLPNGIPTTNGKGKAAKLPSGLPAPEHLWGVVQAEIDRVHSYGTPALPDQIMTAIQAVGGWYLVCKCDPEGNIPARLRDAYRSVING